MVGSILAIGDTKISQTQNLWGIMGWGNSQERELSKSMHFIPEVLGDGVGPEGI